MEKAGNSTVVRSFNDSGRLTIDTSPQSCARFGVQPGDEIAHTAQGINGKIIGTAVLGRGIYGEKFSSRGKKGLIIEKVLWYIQSGEKKVRPIKHVGDIRKIGFSIRKAVPAN